MRDYLVKGSADDAAARELVQRISDHSEDCWRAQWLFDCEFTLWRAVANDDGKPLEWGMADVPREYLRHMRELSEKAGGWIHYGQHTEGSHGERFVYSGPRFVPMAKWLEMFEEHERKHEKVHHG